MYCVASTEPRLMNSVRVPSLPWLRCIIIVYTATSVVRFLKSTSAFTAQCVSFLYFWGAIDPRLSEAPLVAARSQKMIILLLKRSYFPLCSKHPLCRSKQTTSNPSIVVLEERETFQNKMSVTNSRDKVNENRMLFGLFSIR